MAPPIDVSRATRDPDELVRATLMRHRLVSDALGTHTFRASTQLRVRERDQVVEELGVETSLRFNAGGAFEATSSNTRDHGRTVVYVDEILYLAPRYGKFHRRAPETPDEPRRIRDELFGELGAHAELVARGIAVEDRGAVRHEERDAHEVAIVKADRPRQPRRAATPQRRWRDDAVVESVSGRIVLDAATGAPLTGSLRGTIIFQRDARTFAMEFEVEHHIEGIGVPTNITAPADDRWVSTPLRSREVDERDVLLEGIAPAVRQRAQPADPDAPKGGSP